MPFVKAGGSFATAAYGGFENPCVVEKNKRKKPELTSAKPSSVCTLRPVCVPLRISVKNRRGKRYLRPFAP
ncbi:MAG: DUF436 family protein [Clostridiales bacterium]|nr:MAG: DUF436 family protein [Clostridiales bacterium]